MKVIILQAFGKLRSEPMEWPDEPFEIRVPFSKKSCGNYCMGVDVPPENMAMIASFTHTGRYETLDNGRLAAIYELTGI